MSILTFKWFLRLESSKTILINVPKLTGRLLVGLEFPAVFVYMESIELSDICF